LPEVLIWVLVEYFLYLNRAASARISPDILFFSLNLSPFAILDQQSKGVSLFRADARAGAPIRVSLCIPPRFRVSAVNLVFR
jgi:hypothetical protein